MEKPRREREKNIMIIHSNAVKIAKEHQWANSIGSQSSAMRPVLISSLQNSMKTRAEGKEIKEGRWKKSKRRRRRWWHVDTIQQISISSWGSAEEVNWVLPSPHLTSPHLTSPHLTSPHLTSPHLTSPHLTSPHLTSPHLTSPHLTSPHLVPCTLYLVPCTLYLVHCSTQRMSAQCYLS